MRSAANLISGEVVTTSEVSPWMRRPSSRPASCCISISESCGAANTTTSTLSPGGGVAGVEGVEIAPSRRGGGWGRPAVEGLVQRRASGVTPGMWNSATEPKLASAAPKCLSSSELGAASRPVTTGTSQ